MPLSQQEYNALSKEEKLKVKSEDLPVGEKRKMYFSMSMFLIFVIALVAVMCKEPSSTEKYYDTIRDESNKNKPKGKPMQRVSRAQFGEDWPLTVEYGHVQCIEGIWVVFISPDGVFYGVNGAAKQSGKWKHKIEEIWADDPRQPVIPGQSPAKHNISPILDAGRAMCN